MRQSKIDTSKKNATLVMVVTYENPPSETELMELIDKAREYGSVDKAEFTIHRACKKDLV